MPAEEREPVPGASRRRLLAAALSLPAAAVVAAPCVRPDDGPAFAHALERYAYFSRAGAEASNQASAERRDGDAAAEVFWSQGDECDDFITHTPCMSRQAAAVKLRHMIQTTTAHGGLFSDEPEDAELKMLRHVLAYLEGA